MSSLSRRVLAAGALTAALVAGGSTVAFAGTPGPSPSQQTWAPAPRHHHVRAQLWQFDFQGSDIAGLAVNDVEGTSPILMSRWSETDLSPFVSKFFRGPNSVTLLHSRLPLPDLNLQTCTAKFDQVGRFVILRGTGTGAGFRVLRPGTFILSGLISVPQAQKHGRTFCPLAFVSPWSVRQQLETGRPIAGQTPTLVDFDVQGNAQLIRVRPLPVPAPTGPGHFFAPSVTPSA